MIAKNLCLVLVLLSVNYLAAELTVQQDWDNFKTSFQKNYTPEEEARRFQIFQENVQKINEQNSKYARGETTFMLGINQFADLSPADFKARVSGFIPGKTKSGKPRLGLARPKAADPVASQTSLESVSPLVGLGFNSQIPASYSSQTHGGSSNNLQSRLGENKPLLKSDSPSVGVALSSQGSAKFPIASYSSQTPQVGSNNLQSRIFGNPGRTSPWLPNSNVQNPYVAPTYLNNQSNQ